MAGFFRGLPFFMFKEEKRRIKEEILKVIVMIYRDPFL
jgi:hypothetical protein